MKKHIAILLLAFYTLLLAGFELKVFSSGSILAAHADLAIPSNTEDTHENICSYNFHEKEVVERIRADKPALAVSKLLGFSTAVQQPVAETRSDISHLKAMATLLILDRHCIYRI